MREKVVSLRDVEVVYLTPFLFPGRKREWRRIRALTGINLEVKKGGSLAILGDNGAGKSTLLKVIAGIISPDRGEVEVKGRVRTLFELGAGFQPEHTGWDNILLQETLYGYRGKEKEEKAEEIARFAELGDYLYAPLRTYSEGMYVRLAFSIAIHTEPEIFLIDDILSVGDIHFQRKCLEELEKLKEEGVTLIMVTHSLGLAERFCEESVWLDRGRVVMKGGVREVGETYHLLSGKEGEREYIEEGKLRVCFNAGRIFLFWDGRHLTSFQGIYTTLVKGKEIVPSFNAEWKAKKLSSRKLSAEGRFLSFPVHQELVIEIVSERKCRFRVRNHGVKDELSQIGMVFQRDFERWWWGDEGGEVPLERSEEWRELGMKESVDRVRIISSTFPSLLLTPLFSPERVRVFLAGEESGGRAIFWEKEGGDVLDMEIEVERGEGIILPDRGVLRLFTRDFEVTGRGGISLAFQYGNREYYLDRVGGKEREGRVVYEGELPFRIEVEKIREEEGWYITYYLKTSSRVKLDKLRVIFNLNPGYERFITLKREGEFKGREGEWLTPPFPFTPFIILRGENIPSLKLFPSLPSPVLTVAERGKENPIVQFYPSSPLEFPPGRHPLFKLGISTGERVFLSPGKEGEETLSLTRGELRFVWDEGVGRIFYRGREVTGAWGIYFSIRRKEEWEESFKYIWELRERGEDRILLEGRRFHPPHFRSLWEFSLQEEGLIFQVEREEEGEEEIHFSLMLGKEFSRILSPFLREFPHFTPDWETVGRGKGEMRVLSSQRIYLIYRSSHPQVIIKNTSRVWESRVLEFVEKGVKKFRGEIYLGEVR